jgi:hypothetical protein
VNLGKQPGEVSELNVVDRAFDGAARRVTHDECDFRARHLARELHAAQNVVIRNIARNARVEDVADAQVHDCLGGRAGIDTAQDHRRRILTLAVVFCWAR